MIALLGILLILWVACIIIGFLVKAIGWLIIVGVIGLVVTALFGAVKGLARNH